MICPIESCPDHECYYSRASNFVTHLRNNHENDTSLHPIHCGVILRSDGSKCNLMFKSYNLLRLHQLVHNHERWVPQNTKEDFDTFKITKTLKLSVSC